MDEDEEVVLGIESPESQAMPYAAGKLAKSPIPRAGVWIVSTTRLRSNARNVLESFSQTLSMTLKVKRQIP